MRGLAPVASRAGSGVAPTIPRMFAPPTWLSSHVVERAVLLANHVLHAEPAACARLRAHAGKLVMLRVATPAWPLPLGRGAAAEGGQWTQALRITGAGLFEADAGDPDPMGAPADLHVAVDLSRPLGTLQDLLGGQRPALRIEGDAALATDVAWLKDNLRWDFEEDLARLFGDAWAHETVARAGAAVQGAQSALAGWLGRLRRPEAPQ